MTGLLFHGPEVFDSGWAKRLIASMRALGPLRCLLAGTMGRTALHDSALKGVECPGLGPSDCLRLLASKADRVVLATHGKTRRSGLVFGGMVTERAAPVVPVVQAECGSSRFVEWREGAGKSLLSALERLGFRRGRRPRVEAAVWESGGALRRTMSTAEPGDFLLVDGILVGRAKRREVVFSSKGGRLSVQGAEVKAHGLEKLERLGGVDLRTAKLASARALRRPGARARVTLRRGRGLAFIDHAGMRIFELVRGAAGAVTVGDDTTAVAGEVLRRFGMPLLGIVDGDGDGLLSGARMPPGSVVLKVPSDDRFGLRVRRKVFGGKSRVRMPFRKAVEAVVSLAGRSLLSRRDWPAAPARSRGAPASGG